MYIPFEILKYIFSFQEKWFLFKKNTIRNIEQISKILKNKIYYVSSRWFIGIDVELKIHINYPWPKFYRLTNKKDVAAGEWTFYCNLFPGNSFRYETWSSFDRNTWEKKIKTN